MKITIFYSWQSDLNNKENRSLIESSIKKAIKNIDNCEINFTSDSRDEVGTPDLSATIFNKIDTCDIFIADISIINNSENGRLTPNPNVLIELGYAARSIGWSKIICIYNNRYAKIEDLPFDIRGRKPLIYNSTNDIKTEKAKLTTGLTESILSIIRKCYSDQREYLETKEGIDHSLFCVLMDFCKLLFMDTGKHIDKYNYSKLLALTDEEIVENISGKDFLGFYLKRNIKQSINEFVRAFKDELETFFLSEREKQIIAKLIFSLRRYDKILSEDSYFEKVGKEENYIIVSAKQFNENNSDKGYVLLKPMDNNQAEVIAGGDFEDDDVQTLLNRYKIAQSHVDNFSSIIFSIINCANLWLKETGNNFVWPFITEK